MKNFSIVDGCGNVPTGCMLQTVFTPIFFTTFNYYDVGDFGAFWVPYLAAAQAAKLAAVCK